MSFPRFRRWPGNDHSSTSMEEHTIQRAPETKRGIKDAVGKYSETDHPAEAGNGFTYQTPSSPTARYSRSSRLFLNSVKLISVLLMAIVALNFAFDYAQAHVGPKDIEFQKIKALNPIYYEGEPMTKEWAKKAIKDRHYIEAGIKALAKAKSRSSSGSSCK